MQRNKNDSVCLTGSATLLRQSRTGSDTTIPVPLFLWLLLFFFFGPVVFLLELLNATSAVDVFHLPGEERVRCGTDINRDQWVGVPIFPLNRFLGADCRSRQELIVGSDIVKHDRAIVRVNAVFH